MLDFLYLQRVPRNMTLSLPSSVYFIKDFEDFFQSFVKKYFYSNIFYFEINFTIIHVIFFLFGLLKNYGRRHFKLFTNCYVSWDTLYRIEDSDFLF